MRQVLRVPWQTRGKVLRRHEAHRPIPKVSRFDLTPQQRENSAVPWIATNRGEERFNHPCIPLNDLQERPLVIEQHACHVEPRILHPGVPQKLRQLELAEWRYSGAGVCDLEHPARPDGRPPNSLSTRSIV